MAVSDITPTTVSGAPVMEPTPRALFRRRIFGHAGLGIGALVLVPPPPLASQCRPPASPLEPAGTAYYTKPSKQTGSCLPATERNDLDVRAIDKMLDEARDEPPDA